MTKRHCAWVAVLGGVMWAGGARADVLPPLNGPQDFPYVAGHYANAEAGHWTNGTGRTIITDAYTYDYHAAGVVSSSTYASGPYADVTAVGGMGWTQYAVTTRAHMNLQDILSADNPYAIGYGGGYNAWIEELTIPSQGHAGEQGQMAVKLKFHGTRAGSWPTGVTMGRVLLGGEFWVQGTDPAAAWLNGSFSQATITEASAEFTEVVTATIPFVYGQKLRFGISPQVEVGGQWGIGWDFLPYGVTNLTNTLDMMHTVTWDGIEGFKRFDSASGQWVAEAVDTGLVQSATGLDWSAPVAVPEAGTAGVLAGVWMVLSMRRRRG